MKYEIRTSILILILSLVFITVILPSKRVQKETKENFSSGNNQIFVSIASYRDRECDRTIDSIYRQVSNPNNVYVGICQQNNEDEDKDCYENLPSFVPKGNVSIMRLPHFDAKGPTHARYLCSKLWNNQEFYLQIDSHTQFLKDWDKNLISCINECGGEKSVISYFPPAEYNNDDSLEKNGDDKPTEPPSNYNGKIPYTCDARINDKGIVRALSANPINPPKRCMRIPHLAIMLFLKVRLLKRLYHLIHGFHMYLKEKKCYYQPDYGQMDIIFTCLMKIFVYIYMQTIKIKIIKDHFIGKILMVQQLNI